MTNKQSVKTSEARILIYLSQVSNGSRYAGIMSAKLNMDYGYCLSVLRGMFCRKWLRKEQYTQKTYYFLTKKAPLDKAKEMLS